MELKLRAVAVVVLAFVASGCGAAAASSSPSSPTASPVVGEGSSGPFHLQLKLSWPDWHANEPIPGEATLSIVGMDTLTFGSSSSPILFRFDEVGGDRKFVEPGAADCRERTLEAGSPLVAPIRFSDPASSLPVGTWRITASAAVNANGICPNGGPVATVEGRVTP